VKKGRAGTITDEHKEIGASTAREDPMESGWRHCASAKSDRLGAIGAIAAQGRLRWEPGVRSHFCGCTGWDFLGGTPPELDRRWSSYSLLLGIAPQRPVQSPPSPRRDAQHENGKEGRSTTIDSRREATSRNAVAPRQRGRAPEVRLRGEQALTPGSLPGQRREPSRRQEGGRSPWGAFTRWRVGAGRKARSGWHDPSGR
jgi:hypothetical protein